MRKTITIIGFLLLLVLPLLAVAQVEDQFIVTQTITGLPDTDPPTTPTGLTTTPISSTQIDLSWTASTDNVAVAGYQVFRDGAFIATSTLTTYSNTGLTPSTLYAYTVTAFDAVFNISTTSATATATTLDAPAGDGGGGVSGGRSLKILSLVVDPLETSATLSWETSLDTTAVVKWGTTIDLETGSLSQTQLKQNHSVIFPDLIPGTQYYFEIVVYGRFGSIKSATETFFTLTPPGVVTVPTVTNFTAIPNGNQIDLTWTNPSHPDFDTVRIVRSDRFFPEDPFAGALIYEGVGTSAVDNTALPDVTYYYSAFAKDINGNYVSPAIDTARIGGDTGPPLDKFPEAPDERKDLLDLSLDDVEFVQDGSVVPVINNSVLIDGRLTLLVSIDYEKLPEVLKTIGLTLTHPDGERTFSFLLRVNEDKTSYAATLAPLSEPGEYKVTVTALDFEHQKLKTLATTFMILGTEDMGGFGNLWISLLLLILILIILIVIWRLMRRRKKEKLRTYEQSIA